MQLPVTASVAIHQLLLTEEDIGAFDTSYKVLPPLRTATDKDALLAGVRSGVLSVICSDHQPHGSDAKLAPFAEAAVGISGLDSLLALAIELVEKNQIPLATIIAALTCNPAAVISVESGHLGIGATADICIFDPQIEWTLDQNSMRSRGNNTPFMDRKMHGRVVNTLINGNSVYSHKG